MSGHLNPGRARIGRRRFHHGRRKPIWVGSDRHGFDRDPIWIGLHQHVSEWEPIWIGSAHYGFEVDPIWIGLLRMSLIESLHGAGRSDTASDMDWIGPMWRRVKTDMGRVDPLWARHRPDMDWLGRHGFQCKHLLDSTA